MAHMNAKAMAERIVPLTPLKDYHLRNFLSRVNYFGSNGCWEWIGAFYKREDGSESYGRFCYNYQSYCAHRVSYYIEHGLDPGSLLVCHKCNNPKCVNPGHLYIGTNSDNQKQSYSEGRHDQRGVKNPASKLSQEDVNFILSSPVAAPELAKSFGVSASTICNVRRRVCYK